VNQVTITLVRENSGTDQAPGPEKWHYMIKTDSGPWGSTYITEGFNSTDAALDSAKKYLNYRKTEEKRLERGPN
jgi:hypothetical protein